MYLTRSEIRTRVKQYVGDSTSDMGGIFNNGTYNRAISDAYSKIFRQLPWAQGEQLIDTVADTAKYSATEMATIDHIDYDDKPLEIITASRMFAIDSEWQTNPSNEPRYAVMGFKNRRYVDTTDYREFTLYPTPATSAVEIRVIGKLRPLDLLHDFQVPAIPHFLQESIPLEAAARILEMRTENLNPNLAKTLREMAQWYVEIGVRMLNNRDMNKLMIVGSSQTSTRLRREDHIPYTGIAPGDAE